MSVSIELLKKQESNYSIYVSIKTEGKNVRKKYVH